MPVAACRPRRFGGFCTCTAALASRLGEMHLNYCKSHSPSFVLCLMGGLGFMKNGRYAKRIQGLWEIGVVPRHVSKGSELQGRCPSGKRSPFTPHPCKLPARVGQWLRWSPVVSLTALPARGLPHPVDIEGKYSDA